MNRNAATTRAALLGLLAFFIFSGLACRYGYLMTHRHEELHAKAKATYTAARKLPGCRGRIYDGSPSPNLLAMSKVSYRIIATPRHMQRKGVDLRQEIMEKLIEICKVDPAVLKARFDSGKVEIVAADKIDLDAAEKLLALRLRGLRFEKIEIRTYPKGRCAANALGFLDNTEHGVQGVEKAYDKNLQPVDGKVVFEKSARNQKLNEVKEIPPANGKDIYLTIQEPIQAIVEEELQAVVEKFQCKSVYAAMADPKTGAILAFAQYPSFDANDRSSMHPDNYRLRLLEDSFDAGSTMKAFSVAIAFDANPALNLNRHYYCEKGNWFYAGKILRDAGHSYGDLSVREILMHSSNIGTVKTVLDIDPDLEKTKRIFDQGLATWGFNEKTGIGLGTESRGLMVRYPKYDGLTIARYPIGQTFTVTAAQMLNAYCALANKGRMMQLRLVDRIVDPVSGEVQNFPPTFKRHACSEKSAVAVTQGLKWVTTKDGTAPKAAVPGYEVAGKTGTAQKLEPAVIDPQTKKVIQKAYFSDRKYISSFIGYVPADDPKFVLVIIVDEPVKSLGYYGGQTCAPSFSRIADKTLRYMNAEPTHEIVIDPKKAAADAKALSALPPAYGPEGIPLAPPPKAARNR
ncbi:MAG: hypothetical protein RL095_143 [Verrucomicrobiota bacterium]|jgi:cell division protein FtsI/penicillin-binding protein 2